jgi:acetoin utilization deacetylase AcuC-like enzyme
MKVVYSEEFKQVYSYDPASNPGRIESVEFALAGKVDYILPQPASEEDIGAVHTPRHIAEVKREGVYDIAALAAGGAVKAAEIGLSEPCFAVIRPPRTSRFRRQRLGILLLQQHGHRALPSQEA